MDDDNQANDQEEGSGMEVDGPGAVVAQVEKGEGAADQVNTEKEMQDSEKEEKERQDRETDEKVMKERKVKAREEKRMRREDARRREEKRREEELLRLEEEMRRLDGMRDQARKKATAGVKSRLDGRYYGVRSIRSTRPAGRELNRNRREEQPYNVGIGFQGEDERWIRNYNIHNIERALNISCSFNPRLAMCYTCFREPHKVFRAGKGNRWHWSSLTSRSRQMCRPWMAASASEW
jgi:hypothetical protein